MNDESRSIAHADAEAVRALRHAFGRALDTRDWPLFASLFASEVEADFRAWGIPPRTMTPDELVALFRPSFTDERGRSLQTYTSLELRPEADGSIAMTSSLVGHHQREGVEGGRDFELFARYHDRAVRTGGGWRLSALRLEVLFTRGNPKVLG